MNAQYTFRDLLIILVQTVISLAVIVMTVVSFFSGDVPEWLVGAFGLIVGYWISPMKQILRGMVWT